MFECVSRGWAITKTSWAVLKQHPSMLVFPVCSLLAMLAVFGVIGGFVYAAGGAQVIEDVGNVLDYDVYQTDPIVWVWVYVLYFVSTLIAIFFNAALVSCALDAFAGRKPTVGGGFAAALKRLPQILAWSALAATVGLLLNVIQGILRDKLGFLGALLGSLMDMAWAVVTYFVVPVLVVEGVGPIQAVKRSSHILKRTWGESLVGEGGMGIISFFLILPACLLIPAVFVLGADVPAVVLFTVVAVFVLYVLAVSLVFAALNTIFRTGTYLYASTGQVPSAIPADLVQHAFHTK